MLTTILSTEELANHLEDPTWVIVDCRFDLAKPEWGFENYQQGHIPGAVYAHLDRDLAGTITPQTGRHPLPEINEMALRLGNWGISNDTQVVVYDTVGGAFAVRLWWQLRFLGHKACAVLNGGYQKWQKENRPVMSGVESNQRATFIPDPDWSMLVNTQEVEKIRQDPAYKLVDARTPIRYDGEQEPIDPIAGHIPGAINRFHGLNLSSDGTFLPPETLKEQFAMLLGDTLPTNTVVYCGSGITSIHIILALELAGMPGAKLYPGSWSEWIRDPKRPVARK